MERIKNGISVRGAGGAGVECEALELDGVLVDLGRGPASSCREEL